ADRAREHARRGDGAHAPRPRVADHRRRAHDHAVPARADGRRELRSGQFRYEVRGALDGGAEGGGGGDGVRVGPSGPRAAGTVWRKRADWLGVDPAVPPRRSLVLMVPPARLLLSASPESTRSVVPPSTAPRTARPVSPRRRPACPGDRAAR